ncbi:MAG TPA: hypothetical protein VEX17_00750 [Bacillales bacterium]|nr:hypothetical protein [Bacillales bacterium]
MATTPYSNDKEKTTTDKGEETNKQCYLGKLEIKGMCGQYVVRIISKNKNKMNVAPTWKDPNSGKVYKNVFTVANHCSFPSSIQQGQTFNFTITNDTKNDCMTCQAFTPVPDQSIAIQVGCKKGK